MRANDLKEPTKDVLKDATPSALKAAIKIMESWSCNHSQMAIILGISNSSLRRYLKHPEQARLSHDQQTRLSYVLNIYQSIRTIFNNPTNVDNFMSLKNHNGLFQGRAPLDLLLEGSIENMMDTYKHIDSIANGQW
ncbi:antitoxin Xre-like helix-turn-helix domain-containing protein [Thalassotalea mangrovi]|uniref:DUF2384 domain-containing protein n=1 Tax=Thalassotalea mangrovi TaxID=2572245 RepID=A0A4U1B386_9GAMM|nr:antitoxin Xre-like helix-turn-helix domain-containing protein [Thalassotalea mangrovi]TKB43556.1 DUF2384 domain-containing protein [Thalassotalea mangrovi]